MSNVLWTNPEYGLSTKQPQNCPPQAKDRNADIVFTIHVLLNLLH